MSLILTGSVVKDFKQTDMVMCHAGTIALNVIDGEHSTSVTLLISPQQQVVSSEVRKAQRHYTV